MLQRFVSGADQRTSVPGSTAIVLPGPSEAIAGEEVKQTSANRLIREYRRQMIVLIVKGISFALQNPVIACKYSKNSHWHPLSFTLSQGDEMSTRQPIMNF